MRNRADCILTRRNEQLTIGLFSLIFLPGVLLHELSHLSMAVLLGVRTGDFSIIPRLLPDGRLQLGYIETAKTDLVRDSLIGMAPMITGLMVVAYLATHRLPLYSLWDALFAGDLHLLLELLRLLPQIKDFPIWFYLTFTISSTMLPSASDRHSILPLALLISIFMGLALLSGMGSFVQNLLSPLNNFMSSAATILGLSVMVHLMLVIPLVAVHSLLVRITKVEIARRHNKRNNSDSAAPFK